MGKLTDEQKKQLADLQALAAAPDDEDFEIEIFEGDKGARVPYSKGRSWLQRTFGIDVGEPPADDTETGGSDDSGPKDEGTVRAFGRTIRKSS